MYQSVHVPIIDHPSSFGFGCLIASFTSSHPTTRLLKKVNYEDEEDQKKEEIQEHSSR